AAPRALRARLATLRLVLPLALAGSIASLFGAVVGLALPTDVVQIALGVTVVAVAFLLGRTDPAAHLATESDALGEMLRLKGDYHDPAAQMKIDWRTHRTV